MDTSEGPNGAGAPALPHEFPRRILLAVLGLTPQVLTETLYALVSPDDPAAPPFVPTEIHVVTTTAGRDVARRELLDPETGRFPRFCADYRLDPGAIAFDDRSFVVVEREGRPLPDVVRTADHAAVAATMLGLVRRLTADDRAAVHASMAGGRRTMAFYLAHALSLYGRGHDRLSHVLVDPRFAAADAFYYPPPAPATVVIRGRRLNTADARLALTDVPILRLRDELPLERIDALAAYSTPQGDGSDPTARPAIEIDPSRRLIVAGGNAIHLPPANFAFYAVMVRRRALGRGFVNHRTPGLAAEYLREYEAATADQWAPNAARVRHRLRNGADHEWFEQRKARVNHALRDALGPGRSRAYEIVSQGRRPDTRFGVSVDPARITLSGPDAP